MRKGSLSGLDLFKGPQLPKMPLEVIFVSMVHPTPLDHDGARDLCELMQSVFLMNW